jgi:hypothetical protein
LIILTVFSLPHTVYSQTPTPTCNSCVLTPGQNADLVEGQSVFTTSSNSPVTSTSLSSPPGVFEAGNDLVVADGNNRVLVYYAPFTDGQPAIQVFGQGSFTTNASGTSATALNGPRGIWTDGNILIVADSINSRVLIYTDIGLQPSTGAAASIVIGQTSMTASNCSSGASGLCSPYGVFYDGQRLFISDNGNERVLIYNSLPVTDGASADEVIGQPNFNSNSLNQGLSGPTSQTLANPQGIWVYNGSLFVADENNNRVLVFNNGGQGIDTLPEGDASVTADAVVGQGSFTSNSSGNSTSQLNHPDGVSADNCQLFIADGSNDRVLVYNTIPTGTTNPAANVVLGTGSFGPPAADNFVPSSVQAVAGAVNVPDLAGNRVLQFACQSGTGSDALRQKISALSMNMGIREPSSTASPTSTPTLTPTYTVTPSPTVGSLRVVAAPNVSRNGQPVQFRAMLPSPGQVHLSIYNLVGERVYQTSFQGNTGLNSLIWNIQNQASQPLASGLYLYAIEYDDGSNKERLMGKVLVLH